MIGWAATFFIIAIIAGVLGFTGDCRHRRTHCLDLVCRWTGSCRCVRIYWPAASYLILSLSSKVS